MEDMETTQWCEQARLPHLPPKTPSATSRRPIRPVVPLQGTHMVSEPREGIQLGAAFTKGLENEESAS
jgi:hypothetical protein